MTDAVARRRRWARERPDAVLLHTRGRRYTYASFLALAEQAAAALAAAINRELWNTAEGTYDSGFVNDRRYGPTAHAALLALDRGVVPAERVAGARTWFLANYRRPSSFHCGQNPDFERMIADRAGIGMPVTYYWVFQELYRMDSADRDLEALQEMRRRWSRMVNTSADAGTLWETFGGPESCHNYGAVPAYFLSAFVLGVRLDGPVWNRRLLVEPRLGDLTRAEGVVVTELGPAPVSWRREGTNLTFRCEVPKGVQATLRVPDGDAASLVLDGRRVRAAVQGRCAVALLGEGTHAGCIAVRPCPKPAADPDVVERRLSADGAPVTIVAFTHAASPAGLEADVITNDLIRAAAVTEEHVAHDGGGANADALRNGTTRNGVGGDETLNDGKTFRGYGAGSVVTFRLDTASSPGGYDLAGIRTFAGHLDARASQGYAVSVATVAAPTSFVKLADAAVACEGGASELRLTFVERGVTAVRFEFRDGPLGFNVYREINLTR